MAWTALILSALLMAPAADVIGDDEADRYVGSGGLLLPGTFSSETRTMVATCHGCRWRLRDPCGASPGCLISPMPCPDGHRVLETWWSRDAGATWEAIGSWCVGPGGPRTVGQVGREAVDTFSVQIDPAAPSVQPRRGIVTQVPTIWHSGQAVPSGPITMEIAGAHVELRPVPRWEWDFGDGRRLQTPVAGSRHPDLTVSHTYRRPGNYRVVCQTTWRATFTVDGLGPFPVEQDINQRTERTITVYEARARLVR